MDFSIASILLLDGVTNGAVYGLLGLATVLVFAVTRVIFIPQGEFVAYGALTLAILQTGKVPGTVWLLLILAACASLMELFTRWQHDGHWGKAVRAALKTLLAPPAGKTCQMYTSKGPKTVKMSLKGNTLVWESSSSFMASKTYSIDLATVLFVTANKKSKNLRSKAVVPDELCFSLVTHDASLDISVDRKNERDVLVLGFGEIVSQLKSASNP